MRKQPKEIIKRGGIYWINHSVDKEKKWPCLVISNNVQNEINRFVVTLPIIHGNLAEIPFHIKIELEKKPANIVTQRIHTVDKYELESYSGQLDQETMLKVEKLLSLVLNLKIPNL